MKTDINDSFSELRFDDTEWMTQKGTILSIKNMDKMHIFNTVRLLQARNNQLQKRGKRLYEIPRLLIEANDIFREEMPEYFV